MPTQFTLEYTIFVFVGALGTVQLAAAANCLSGMLFYRRSPLACAVGGLVLVMGAFIWFFASAERNQPDTGLGLDGNNQAFWFAMATLAAVGITMAVASTLNHRWGRRDGLPSGIDALRQTTFLRALLFRLRSHQAKSR
jgi:hypothetical protein